MERAAPPPKHRKLCYLDRLLEGVISASHKARRHPDRKAWENVKAKLFANHYPRGPAILRMRLLEGTRTGQSDSAPQDGD